tara:strand:+ start:235 stop:504 length:270 start_codon:yes stop_codon:yes gene_type:complete
MIYSKELKHIETNGQFVTYSLNTKTSQNNKSFLNCYICTAKICGMIDLHSDHLYLSPRSVENGNLEQQTNEATLTDEAILTLLDEIING